MLVARYKTKKDLRAAVGQALQYEETSFLGAEYCSNGTFCVVGPAAYCRKWYASITMENDKIKKVS